ncbi:MAG: hypothetical protein HOI53_04600 [Francisellaceae bacterium]|nr:hypothetical protein [Francisellaceae bacterium]
MKESTSNENVTAENLTSKSSLNGFWGENVKTYGTFDYTESKNAEVVYKNLGKSSQSTVQQQSTNTFFGEVALRLATVTNSVKRMLPTGYDEIKA